MSTEQKDPNGTHIKISRQEITRSGFKGSPSEAGTVGKTIGTGENAKNSIVWLTIKWSMLAGAAITSGLFIERFWFNSGKEVDLIDNIKVVWSIFMPVITLALGYLFGKSSR